MAANKIKFEMSLERLTFKFEGDYEQGQRIQQGINKSLTQLADLQSGALGLENKKPVIDTDAEVTRPPKRRRKRQNNASSDASAAEVGGGAGAESSDTPSDNSGRKGSTGAPTDRLIELKKDGFFAEPKGLGEITLELGRRGHTGMSAGSLSPTLARLCQKKILDRQKDATKNVWVYVTGANDE